MEKENKTIQAITEQLYNRLKKTELEQKFLNHIVLPKNSYSFFKQNKNKEKLYIYDIAIKKNKYINNIKPINNHINKTGTNTLRTNKPKRILFYDITNIYEQKKKGEIIECIGENKSDKTNKIKTKYLCHHTINAHYFKIKKIYAYVVV